MKPIGWFAVHVRFVSMPLYVMLIYSMLTLYQRIERKPMYFCKVCKICKGKTYTNKLKRLKEKARELWKKNEPDDIIRMQKNA